MDEAEACPLHTGDSRAKRPQQEKPRSLLERLLEVEVGTLEIVAVAHCEIEELILEIDCELEEEGDSKESGGQKAVRKKGRIEVLAEGESQLVLMDE
jgi:hypothetical protein